MLQNLRSTISSVLCVCIMAMASVSVAGDKSSAKRHFEFGLTFLEDENFGNAAREFEASVAIYTTKNSLFNLANCYLSMRRYKDAIETMDRLVSLFNQEIDDVLRREIEVFEKKLDDKVVRLEIQVNVDGATVQIDGQKVGEHPLGKPLVLELGEYEIMVSRDGYKSERREVELDSGGKTKLTLELEREPSEEDVSIAPPTETEDIRPTDSGKDKKGISGLLLGSICSAALGLAGAGVGIYFSVKYNEHFDEVEQARKQFEEKPTNTTYGIYEKSFKEANDDKLPKDQAGMAVGYAVGGVLIATGIVLFMVDRLKKKKNQREAITVVPTLNGLAVTF